MNFLELLEVVTRCWISSVGTCVARRIDLASARPAALSLVGVSQHSDQTGRLFKEEAVSEEQMGTDLARNQETEYAQGLNLSS
jgi:hypothetical protein